MSKWKKVQLRFPNSCWWETIKINLSEFEIVNVFDDQVFLKNGANVISVKKTSLPKTFLKNR
jgi:hypothetical protein